MRPNFTRLAKHEVELSAERFVGSPVQKYLHNHAVARYNKLLQDLEAADEASFKLIQARIEEVKHLIRNVIHKDTPENVFKDLFTAPHQTKVTYG